MSVPTSVVDQKLLSFLVGLDLNNYPFDDKSVVPNTQLKQLKSCQWLNLKRNGLHELPEPVADLLELEYLSLAYNKISEISKDFEDLAESLQVLDLRWNRLQDTLSSNDHLGKLANLTILDLSHNPICMVPGFLEQLKQLRYLSLQDTKINAVPGSLFISLSNLTYLDLSNNDLDSLPVQLRRLVQLKTLNLNNNPALANSQLKQISSILELEVLYLSNTGRSLDNMPPDLSKLSNLYDVDLSNNSLAAIPESLFSCVGLKRLNLSDNSIREIPDSIGMWLQLETLNLARNEISRLPSDFGKLVNLRNLYMDCNQLNLESLLSCNLSRLNSLEVVSLAFNMLESIPEALCRCTRMRKLNLMANKLVNVPESIHFLNLEDLNVSENPNFSMPPKSSVLSVIDPKAALYYNIDFSLQTQLAKAKMEQKPSVERTLSHSSSVDSIGATHNTLSRQRSVTTNTGSAAPGNRKMRIQKRKEEEANSSDAAMVLKAMRKVAEDSKDKDIEKTNMLLSSGFEDEHCVSRPLRWDERLKAPQLDYSEYFESDIGEVDGVHVWYISNFSPVLLEMEENGNFYQQDCYIVLNNISNGNEVSHRIFFWIGKDSERDKQTCVAMHAVSLRNWIRASCRTEREDQDDESEEFLAMFGSHFQILEGGHGQSGFNHYEKQAANQYLFCLNTNLNQIAMHLVELSPESLDPRYIFLLDMGRVIFMWVGNKTPSTKLSKARFLGEKISKNERKGHSRVLIVRQGSEPVQFWRGLLVEDPDTFTYTPTEWLDLNEVKKPNLYNVNIKQVDNSKYFELSHVERKSWSLEEDDLNPKAVHILDAQTAVFVWEGRKSTRILKRASFQLAGVLLRTVIRQDEDAGVIVEKQGFESEFFKSFFSKWDSDKCQVDYTKDNKHLPLTSADANDAPEAPKQAKASLSALFASRLPNLNIEDMEYDRLYYYEDLKHTTAFWFNGQTFVKTPDSEFGQFYCSDSYVLVLYYVHPPDEEEEEEDEEQGLDEDESVHTPTGSNENINKTGKEVLLSEYKHEFRIVFWKGRDSSNKAFFDFNFQFGKEELPKYIDQQIDKLKHGLNLPDMDATVEAPLVISQQAEDISFLISLNQQIIIHQGSRKEAKSKKSGIAQSPRLHCVRSNAGSVFIRCIEIECDSSLFNSSYCFILGVPFDQSESSVESSSKSNGIAYVWYGNKSDVFLQQIAKQDAIKIYAAGSKKYTIQEVHEGSEPGDELFWQFVGGKQPYEQDSSYIAKCQLFRCSNLHGFFGVSVKFNDFSQADLTPNDVMILDSGFNVYLWLGENASDTVVRLAYKSAVMYMQYRERKKPAKLLATKKGLEPWEFKRVFHGWAAWPPPKFIR